MSIAGVRKNENINYIVATAFEESIRNKKESQAGKKNPSNPENLSREELLCLLEEKGACSPYSF